MKQREPREPGRMAEEPGPGTPQPRFRAPGAGPPPDGPDPQDARATGHLNTQTLEGDDS